MTNWIYRNLMMTMALGKVWASTATLGHPPAGDLTDSQLSSSTALPRPSTLWVYERFSAVVTLVDFYRDCLHYWAGPSTANPLSLASLSWSG